MRESPRRSFVKTGSVDDLPLFLSEVAGLAALRTTATVRVPEVYECAIIDGRARLEMEHFDLYHLDAVSGARLGTRLADLHRHAGDRYGYDHDNFIGDSPQRNDWHLEWPHFFATCRLLPQLERAGRNGMEHKLVADGERLAGKLSAFFLDYQPVPSLLHGDLWAGNAGALADGTPVVFDPAVYYGDREADLAMSELFGGFPESFYAGYRNAWALDPGYETRKTLYNLYHILNHLNLFGLGYLGQARRMIGRLLADLRG